MPEEDWKIIRRELGVNQEIEKIIEEKVEIPEPTPWYKTDITEFILKVIAAFGIIVPLLLFYFQYRADNTKKRNEDLAEVYTNVAFDIQTVLNTSPVSEKFITANANLLFRYPSQIALFEKNDLNTSYDAILPDLRYYLELKRIKNFHDSIYDHYSSIFRYYTIQRYEDEVSKIEFFQKSDAEVAAIVSKLLPMLSQYQNLIQSHPHEYFQAIDSFYKSDNVLNTTSKEIIKILERKTEMQNQLDYLRTYLNSGDKSQLKYLSTDQMQELNRLNDFLVQVENRVRKIIDTNRQKFQDKILVEIND